MDEKVGFYLVKMFSIFLISIYYFIFGSTMSIIVNKNLIDYSDKEIKKINTYKLFLDICITFGIIGLGFYLIRIIVKNVPYVFDGWFGYQHSKLKEATGGVIIAYIIFAYQSKLLKKFNELKNRLNIYIA